MRLNPGRLHLRLSVVSLIAIIVGLILAGLLGALTAFVTIHLILRAVDFLGDRRRIALRPSVTVDGKISQVRTPISALTTVAINTIPPFVPYGASLIFQLNRSKKITPTLEQMSSTSNFTQWLNSSDDPGVRYTIVGGMHRTIGKSLVS